MRECRALLPLKDLVQAKTRLGGVLASHERRALAQAMAEDVLTALTSARLLSGVLLVSDDPGADMLAGKYGVDYLPEAELGAGGLNAVVAAGCAYLQQQGAEQVMVVHSDLPLLQAADVDAVLQRFLARSLDLLLVPDRRRDGTNILLARSDALPEFHYGCASFDAHRAAGLERELAVGEIALAGVALDVDQPADLIDAWQGLLRGNCRGAAGSHTRAFLARSDISRRLAALSELYAANTRGAQ